MRDKLKAELLKHKVIVILRNVIPERVIETCEVIATGGAHFLEIPLNTPNALKSIKLAANHFRDTDIHIGAGTVLAPEQVDAVNAVGGKYIISPNTVPAVIKRTRELGLLSIPGFATPTEAFAAIDAGADFLKNFPCNSPNSIAVLKSVIPLAIFAVGGINRKNLNAYLKVSDGVGVGIGIFHPGMTRDELANSVAMFFGE